MKTRHGFQLHLVPKICLKEDGTFRGIGLSLFRLKRVPSSLS